MTQREISAVANGFTYLEGPRWHQGSLWFVDFYTCGVHSGVPRAHNRV